ncbi:MAG: J domain-containing protein [Syntrophomonadaceae bacterium]|nr:J domain-containing protein [Syntrophomonadaceae bacterium]
MSKNYNDDYYQILGVEHTADLSTIEAQFQVLMKQLESEPNKNFGRIQKLKEAYLVLGDELNRCEYDFLLKNPPQKRADERVIPAKIKPSSSQHSTRQSMRRSNNTGVILTMIFITAFIVLARLSPTPDTRSHNDPITPAGVSQGSLNPVNLPPTGKIASFSNADSLAPLKISGAPGVNYYIKLVDNNTGQTMVTIFLRAGETVQTKIPLGTYKMRTAQGDTWYGKEAYFGPETQFTETTESIEFYRTDFQIMGQVITLQSRQDGNLHTEAIRSDEF